MRKIYLVLLLVAGICQAQIVDIPDANLKNALIVWEVDTNLDGEIQNSEAAVITTLSLQDSDIQDFAGLEAFVNLIQLNVSNNLNANNLNVSTMSNLQILTCGNTAISSLDLSGNSTLEILSAQSNTNLTALILPENSSLKSLSLSGNALTSLDLSGQDLTTFICHNSNILSINLQSTAIESLTVEYNQYLTELLISSVSIAALSLNHNVALANLKINADAVDAASISSNDVLENVEVHCGSFPVHLMINSSVLSTVDLSGTNFYPYQVWIYDSSNLTSVNLSNCTLSSIEIETSGSPDIDLSGISGLSYIYIKAGGNLAIPSSSTLNNIVVWNVSNLTFGDLPSLESVDLYGVGSQLIDFSLAENLNDVAIYDCQNLTQLILKNGSIESSVVALNCPELVFACVDEEQIGAVTQALNNLAVSVNSYCTVEPGGGFNRLNGHVIYDVASDGCGNDTPWPYVKVIMSDGENEWVDFTDADGEYRFYTMIGNYSVTPQLEVAPYFNISPATANANFEVVDGSVITHDFCISANGSNPDIEVIVSPQGSPVPGFPATYLVTLRNKGNQVIESALLSCSYNEQQMDFTSAQPTETEVNNGVIYWNYSNLMPFETRTFAFDMVIHAPTDETPVNSGDEVIVSAAAGFEFDVLPADNNFTLTQMAVNSFDPNDILCLEGDLQPTSAIGDYLHYRVRFENTGTAPAQNIVVRIPIDQQRFQLNSLQLLSASHGVRATVRDSIAEFMFRNINLDSGGHGNVLLKIRSAATLQQGDSVLNNAGIYFDYNFPILTNEAETVFSDLSTGVITADASIVMYPNPTIESVRINASSTIEKAEVFDSQGRLVEVVRFDNKKNAILATSHLASGTYILRISSASGTSVQKLIKI